ncbi:pituitary adenylate cyclase-activating polypeptide type I receptor-like isoform X2 [Leguminivora glycinivorella]|uniref:pituitary adenylate cyclase-activating polypeptide type I receptor-like isoform X2 n=1 Tax=Leguminivora glycinivorella TaxID=1035111 RepID=UPI00200C15E6|nr:pituitary adenylate cyclase-activating polypeptide type I receptor-like isoform X2 [Leguminivora glycinivorella]
MCGLDKVTFFCFIPITVLAVTKGDYTHYPSLNPEEESNGAWNQRNNREALRLSNDDIYVCEEPADTAPPESNRSCNYRNVDYHEQIYKWVSGRGCLLYTPDFLYVDGANSLNLNNACLYGNLRAPCLEIVKDDGTYGCYPFDPGLEEVVVAVKNALIPSAHGRWERCFEEAAACCNQYMALESARKNYLTDILEDYALNEEHECNPTFDGWTCWQSAPSGTTAVEVCSEFAYSSQGPTCHHFSSRECYQNGTWELQTDYSTCSITSRLLRRYRFYIAMLAFSIASCLPAIGIFFFYKRLRLTRVALHRNLLIAIVTRNVLVIISRSAIYIDELTNPGETVMSTHAVGCRILAILERVAANTVFVCMLVEGVYLHRVIVTTFRRKLKIKWLYASGAVIAIVPVLAWSIVMGLLDDHSCWVVYTVSHIQWILDAPRLAVLIINTLLFVDVLRVLLTKIRNSENANQLSTTKATLFLMPIFGSQFLLTAFRPNTTNCTGEQAYYYITYTVEGLQGFVVAMLYCYVNKEVRMLIMETYRKTENAVVSRVRGDSYVRPSLNPNSRRMTYSTNLPSQFEDPKDNVVLPKLHVAEIISINNTEKLAEILDPVYETIDAGETNAAYSYGSIQDLTRDKRDYHNYTNASSTSYENEDWIRSVTSHESEAPNSHYELDENREEIKLEEVNGPINTFKRINDSITNTNYTNNKHDDSEQFDNDDSLDETDHDSMFDEIFNYIDLSKDNLDPELLSPNRQKEDRIVFVNE